jgi:hypothetical protein
VTILLSGSPPVQLRFAIMEILVEAFAGTGLLGRLGGLLPFRFALVRVPRGNVNVASTSAIANIRTLPMRITA